MTPDRYQVGAAFDWLQQELGDGITWSITKIVAPYHPVEPVGPGIVVTIFGYAPYDDYPFGEFIRIYPFEGRIIRIYEKDSHSALVAAKKAVTRYKGRVAALGSTK